MNALFAVLLVLTAAASVLLMLTVLPRRRPAVRGRTAIRAVGMGQLVVGVLWVLFGVSFLRDHGARDGRGWYAVVLGGLWAWQAVRRFAATWRR